jgi:hypothetical protein
MHELINETVRVFSLCRDGLWSTLEENRDTDPGLVNFVHAQSYFIGDRSQSLVILIQNGRLWDAEIIMRTIMEATIHILFVCYTHEDERGQKIREFWSDLAEINDLKRSEKAKIILQRIGSNRSTEMGIKPLVLTEDEEKALRDKWPKKRRQSLEQKWSFTEIVFFLESNMHESRGGELIRSTLHNYALSSHLIHADETALSLLWDRNHRAPEEQEKLISAHASRLLSDSLTFMFVVWSAVLDVFRLEKSQLNSIFGEAKALFQQFHKEEDLFWRTQET